MIHCEEIISDKGNQVWGTSSQTLVESQPNWSNSTLEAELRSMEEKKFHLDDDDSMVIFSLQKSMTYSIRS